MAVERHDEEASGERVGVFATLRRMVPLFAPHRRTLLVALVLLACTTASQLAGPLFLRHAIDVDMPLGDVPGLLLVVAGYAAALAVTLLLSWFQRVRLEAMGQSILAELRRKLFSRLLAQSLDFHDRHPAGRLVARVQGDTDALRQLFSSTFVTIVETSVLLASTLVVMAFVSWKLTLLVAAVAPVMALLAWRAGVAGSVRFRDVRRRSADLSAFVAERVQGIAIVQAFSREDDARRELDALNGAKFRSNLAADACFMLAHQGVMLFEVFAIALTLGFGGTWALEGHLTIGTLFLFVEYIRRLFSPLAHLSENLSQVQRGATAGSRVLDLLDLEPSVVDDPAPLRWNGLQRDLELRDVSFSYRGDGEWALRHASFTVPRGQVWALVGATGSGKSSVLNLLLRFYDPQEGAVLVDGVDVRRLPQRELRRTMALVLQDVHLFPGDVASNVVAHGGDADEALARARCAVEQAGIAQLVDALPQGLRTPISERGGNLSAGQRQLLAFARALATDPQVLLLDEATASVDPHTEAQVQRAMRTLLAGRTALVIAHRLSTVRDADQILVLSKGRVVERGRHEELLHQGGHYAALHALQFSGVEGGLAS